MIQLSSAPRLALLKMIEAKDGKKIEIIKTVAPRWKDVGDLLDFDETGETLKEIEADKSGKYFLYSAGIKSVWTINFVRAQSILFYHSPLLICFLLT